MTRSRTRDRLGLMGIASAIALSAAIGWSPSAWSADKNQQQWQQQGQSHQQGSQGGQNHGQPPQNFKPQANNQQPAQWQNQGQSHNNSQPKWKAQNGQAQNGQGQAQWKNGQINR